jgi:penicillin-binding protein 1A
MIRLQNHTNIELPRENMKWAGDQLEKTLKIGDILRVRKLKNNAWKLAQVPKVEGAFVALNATNGAILALTGGFDFQRNKYNRATQSKRQPGSGFKPIIYSAALEEGYTPASMINDAPLVIDIAGQETEWRPENYNRKFLGPTSLRAAIAHSRNIISIRLLNEIGIDKAIKTAMRFGFSEEQLPKSLSLALGSGYASPLQMARVYAAFANGGFLVEPYFIERIEAPKGDIIYQAKPKIACAECNINYASPNSYAPRVLSADINFLMNSMLRDVVQKGTAIKAKNLNRQDLAGKTGTTNEQRDAWFNGFVPTIASTAWVGFDDFTPLGEHETGGTAALPMWIEFMQTALQETPEKPFEAPQGVIKAFINPATGLLASEKSSAGVWEFFQIEHQPNKVAKPGIDTAPETSHQDVIEALF